MLSKNGKLWTVGMIHWSAISPDSVSVDFHCYENTDDIQDNMKSPVEVKSVVLEVSKAEKQMNEINGIIYQLVTAKGAFLDGAKVVEPKK